MITNTNKLKLAKLLAINAIIFTFFINKSCFAESFSAKRAGQGFTNITQDFTSSLSNPALLPKFDRDDDAFFSLNLGIMGSDKYEVIDNSENIAMNLQQLADDINSLNIDQAISLDDFAHHSDDLNQQVDKIVTDLTAIDQKVVNTQNGINFQVIIPNKYLSFGLFTNQYGRVGGAVDYVETDEILLREAINKGYLDLNDVKSSARGIGYSIVEAGIMAGGSVASNKHYDVNAGMKVKYQRIDLFYNRVNISEFDEDEFDLDNEENLTKKSVTNFDLGLYISWGDERQWHGAIVTNNIMSQQVVHQENNLTFSLETSSTLGFSYQVDWLTVATEIDLTDREHFASLAASKYASVGAEFRAGEDFQLRLGYRADLNDVDANIITAGIGVSPWDVFSVDIAGFIGEKDTYGAAIEFGLKI